MARTYLTTTLPYVNAAPHIGFALEIIQADVVARHRRLQGDEVVFNTGTDEHGLKIYRAAQAEKKAPQAYVNEWAEKFDRLKSALDLSYTNFVRTTDPHHMAAAQEFWRRCATAGDIYKKTYQVKYCVGCELEKTNSELVDGRCPIHPNMELEEINEENYFFRFSKYGPNLLELYKAQPDFVMPESRGREIQRFVEAGLQDFSISRVKEKMPWGVPVPDDDSQVMYVWFDALVNYISTLGWPENEDNFKAYWPGIQFAGKDNLRQQSAMWQAMLMSAGLPPSKQVVIHGFITSDGQKMSKSLGNVVDPFALVEKYGTDAVRYWLLREMPPFEDGDFTEEKFHERYTADLVNGLGNLVSRIAALGEACGPIEMKNANFHIEMPAPWNHDELLAGYRFHEVLARLWQEFSAIDKYINDLRLWEQEPKFKKHGVAACALGLLYYARLLEPFLPHTVALIREKIKVDGNTIHCTKGAPLFPRLS
ncbi:MAG TPA: methionine--tRNA ligase [Candidatus Paceibacterota bacterium]|nr:methionine--tRNA ligase [Candidatus Paceibacterota bacterium]